MNNFFILFVCRIVDTHMCFDQLMKSKYRQVTLCTGKLMWYTICALTYWYLYLDISEILYTVSWKGNKAYPTFHIENSYLATCIILMILRNLVVQVHVLVGIIFWLFAPTNWLRKKNWPYLLVVHASRMYTIKHSYNPMLWLLPSVA